MILGCDFNPSRFQILDGLIYAVMAELQFFREPPMAWPMI